MSLSGLLDLVAGEPKLASLLRDVSEGDASDVSLVAPPALRPFAVAALAREGAKGAARTVLAVTATGREAEDLAAAPRQPAAAGARWPSSRPGRRCRTSGSRPRCDTVGRRLAVLRRLAHPVDGDPATGPLRVVVAPVRPLLQPQRARARRPGAGAAARRRRGRPGRGRPPAGRRSAYARVDLVEQRGEFAVRGGILDVFPPTEEHPLRVEFWGDEVEEIRSFEVADQRSLEVAPRRPLGAALPRAAADRRGPRAGRARSPTSTRSWPSPRSSPRASRSRAWSRSPRCSVDGDGAARRRAAGRQRTSWSATRSGSAPGPHDLVRPRRSSSQASWVARRPAAARRRSTWAPALPHRSAGRPRHGPRALGQCPGGRSRPFGADADDRRAGRRRGDRTVASTLATPLHGRPAVPRRHRAARSPTSRAGCARAGGSSLRHRGPRARPSGSPRCSRGADLAARLEPSELPSRRPTPASSTSPTGPDRPRLRRPSAASWWCSPRPTWPAASGPRTRDMRQMPVAPAQHDRPAAAARPATTWCTSSTASAATSRWCSAPSQGATREYLVIEYAPASAASPATGSSCRPTSSTRSPVRRRRVARRCTGSAARTGPRPRPGPARRSSEIAAELIQLYAARMAVPGPRLRPGHALAARAGGRLPLRRDAGPARRHRRGQGATWSSRPDGPADLRRRRLRQDRDRGPRGVQGGAGRQAGRGAGAHDAAGAAALLHLRRALRASSRSSQGRCPGSRPTSEAEAVLEGLADGTRRRRHRHPPAVLPAETRFKDLGLVIVDEEQRFGVEHKEHLKQLRTAVDVLTMSRDPDPAHAGDGGHRHPGDVHDRTPRRRSGTRC